MTEQSQQQSQDQHRPSRSRGGLLRSSLVTGSMTMVSRVLGLVREQPELSALNAHVEQKAPV